MTSLTFLGIGDCSWSDFVDMYEKEIGGSDQPPESSREEKQQTFKTQQNFKWSSSRLKGYRWKSTS